MLFRTSPATGVPAVKPVPATLAPSEPAPRLRTGSYYLPVTTVPLMTVGTYRTLPVTRACSVPKPVYDWLSGCILVQVLKTEIGGCS